MLPRSRSVPKTIGGAPSFRELRFLWTIGHASLAITLLLFVVLGWAARNSEHNPYEHIWALILAHFFLGRAGNAGIGLELGFSPLFLLYQAFMQDFIVMCYVFPVFASGMNWLERTPLLGAKLQRMHRETARRRDQLRPYGIAGLFVFVMFPFFSTGPFIGLAIGHLLGLRVLTNFSVVLVADLVATGAWMWGYNALRNYDQNLAYALLAVAISLALVGALVYRVRKYRNRSLQLAAIRDAEAPIENTDEPESVDLDTPVVAQVEVVTEKV